jgi:hypothetical protein
MCEMKRTRLALVIFAALFGWTGGGFAGDQNVERACPSTTGGACVCSKTAGGTCPSRQLFDDKKSTTELSQVEKTRKLIDELYTYEDPYNIPEAERKMIQAKGGDPVYGTCLYDSLQVIMDDLPEKVVKNGVFYDLGSGAGRLCTQTYLNYPFKKVVGIELSTKRYAYSEVVKSDLAEHGLLEKGRTLEFRLEDIAEADMKDATVAYMCSTCYPDKLMLTMTQHFSKLKKGLHVITLRPLSDYENYGFVLIKSYNLPMSWSKGTTPVYVYKLGKKAKKKTDKKVNEKKEKKPVKEKKAKKEKKSKKKSKKEQSVEQEPIVVQPVIEQPMAVKKPTTDQPVA